MKKIQIQALHIQTKPMIDPFRGERVYSKFLIFEKQVLTNDKFPFLYISSFCLKCHFHLSGSERLNCSMSMLQFFI